LPCLKKIAVGCDNAAFQRLILFSLTLSERENHLLFLSLAYLSFNLINTSMQSLTAIADPTRRRIIELLADRDRTSGELVEKFDVSAPAISQHLNVLREAGLIVTRIEGQSRIQSLNPAGFDEVDAWLEKTRALWSRRLDALERELRADDARLAKTKSSKKRKSL
jgi:DNA-binding transcriptional ArsR family regulator